MTVIGTSRLLGKLSRLAPAATQRISDELEAGAAGMYSHAVKKIQASGSTGRTYRRKGVTHVASAPGEFPNADRGELVAGMGWRSTSALSSEWYSRSRHALPLEIGTSKITP